MSNLFAALALAGALTACAPAAAQPPIHLAQMSRDVTGAVRGQRARQAATRRHTEQSR